MVRGCGGGVVRGCGGVSMGCGEGVWRSEYGVW